MYDPALLFGLRVRVGKEQPLTSRDHGFEHQQAAFRIGVESFGFLVERLPVGVRTVNEERRVMRVSEIFSPVGVVMRVVRSSIGRRIGGVSARS
jgi:hypothetical protein